MRRFVIASAVLGATALFTYGCTTGNVAPSARERVAAVKARLLNGTDAGTASGTVALFLDAYTRVCSGTLLTPQWLITSSGCVPANGTNDMWIQLDANNGVAPNRIVPNAALGVALVQLPSPVTNWPAAAPPPPNDPPPTWVPRGPGGGTASNALVRNEDFGFFPPRPIPKPIVAAPAVRPLYNGALSAVRGKSVVAYGAGNGSTTDPAPNPTDLGLRQGSFTVADRSADTFNLTPVGNVQLVAGDEGGGTVYSDGTQSYLLGVHVKDGAALYDVATTRFHDWAMEQIYGVPSFVDSFTRDPSDGFLVAGSSESRTWSPCPSGGAYTWSAAYDFGTDASGAITVGASTTPLAGNATSSGSGTGAMTIAVKTGANQVQGLTSLTATCDVATLACAGTECVTSVVTRPSQTLTATWAPCGATGCFAWGATLNGNQTGDSIQVAGVTATASTPSGVLPVGDTCGSVPVQVNVGAANGTRTEMDVWAICGCDDQAHTCAPAADGNTRCGTVQNACGLSFSCGTCATGATCNGANECVCPPGWTRNADGSCFHDVCATNNGGCAESATCTSDSSPGGNHATCACHPGYVGDGTSCVRNPQAPMFTDVGPSVMKTPDGVMFLAADRDHRIYGNRVVLGQAGQGWRELGGRTDATPSAAISGKSSSYVFMAFKGTNNRVYLDQGDLGGGWVGAQPIGMDSYVAPTVASTADGILTFVVGTNGHPYVSRVVLGGAGGPWVDMGGSTSSAVGAAVCGNAQYVFAAMRGNDGYLYINQADVGGSWVGWSRTTFQTKYAPTVATTPDGVLVFAVGLDDQPYSSRIVLGQAGGPWTGIGGVSTASVGAALCGNSPYVFAAERGSLSMVAINQASLGGGWVGWR